MMGKQKFFQLEDMMIKQLAYAKAEYLVLIIPPNLKNKLVLRKVYHFMYMVDIMKAYPKVTLLALI